MKPLLHWHGSAALAMSFITAEWSCLGTIAHKTVIDLQNMTNIHYRLRKTRCLHTFTYLFGNILLFFCTINIK